MKAEVRDAYSLPQRGSRGPRAIVLSLYSKGGDQTTVFDSVAPARCRRLRPGTTGDCLGQRRPRQLLAQAH